MTNSINLPHHRWLVLNLLHWMIQPIANRHLLDLLMLHGQAQKLAYVVHLLPVIPIDTTYMSVFIVKTTKGKIFNKHWICSVERGGARRQHHFLLQNKRWPAKHMRYICSWSFSATNSSILTTKQGAGPNYASRFKIVHKVNKWWHIKLATEKEPNP